MSVKTVIEARRHNWHINFRELIQYRELLLMLAYRDYKIRYAQTVLGILWAVIQPLLTLLIFVLVFNRAARVTTGEIPYPVFAMTGMWAWSYFSYVMSQAGQSIISSQALITKVYFPRLIIPISKSMVGFIDFIIAFILLLALMLYHQITPGIELIYLPVMILSMIVLSLATGIWLSALSIRFRDIQYVVPFMVQLGLYFSPIAYPSSMIPEEIKAFYYINPVAGLIDGFRWSLLGTPLPDLKYLLYSGVTGLVLLISGMYYFRKVESQIADIL